VVAASGHSRPRRLDTFLSGYLARTNPEPIANRMTPNEAWG
jgi:hypothetical protein